MERSEHYTGHSKEASWTEEQEKEYWHKVNKRYDARQALAYLSGLSSAEIVDTIAAAKGYGGSDIFEEGLIPALAFETAATCFLEEVQKINAARLQTKTAVADYEAACEAC